MRNCTASSVQWTARGLDCFTVDFENSPAASSELFTDCKVHFLALKKFSRWLSVQIKIVQIEIVHMCTSCSRNILCLKRKSRRLICLLLIGKKQYIIGNFCEHKNYKNKNEMRYIVIYWILLFKEDITMRILDSTKNGKPLYIHILSIV